MVDRSVEVTLRLNISNWQANAAAASASMTLLAANAERLDDRMTRVADSSQRASTRLRAQDRAAQGLSGSLGGLNGNLSATNALFGANNQQSNAFVRNNGRAADSINLLTGRLAAYGDAALILGPGLIPIAAVGATAIGGLATAAAGAAAAAGTAVIAFQGVGDATKALDAYQADKTVANFEKAQAALDKLGPDAARFVMEFQKVQPMLTALRDSAAAGLFPGLTDSLDDFENLEGVLGRILKSTGQATGTAIASGADSLDSKRWRPFLRFLEDEMPSAVSSLSRILGSLSHGAAEMWMSFDPGNDAFLGWVDDVAEGFDGWASSDAGREDVEGFLAYARQNGPAVASFFTSLVGAAAAVVKAAAPLGGTVLSGLTAALNVIEAIASSDLGAPIMAGVIALRLFNRTAALTAAVQGRMATAFARPTAAASAGAGAGMLPPHLIAAGAAPHPSVVAAQRAAQRAMIAKGAGLAAGGAFLMSGAAEEMQLTNTTMLTLIGTMAGPWGAAAGAAAGFALDLSSANKDLQASIEAVDAASVEDPLQELVAKRQQMIDEFAETTNKGGFGGAMGRISSWLGNDDDEVVDGVRNIDNLIAARRELDSLETVDPAVGLFNNFGKFNGELARTNSLLYDFTAALSRAQGFLSDRAAMVAYEESLDQVGRSLEENGKTLNINTAKGRANIRVLDGIASAGLQVAETLKGKQRATFLDGLRADVRGAARELGLGDAKVHDLLNSLGLLDRKKVKPTADVDTVPLDKKTKDAVRKLRQLDGENANPFVDLFTDPFFNGADGVRGGLRNLDGSRANPNADLDASSFYNGAAGVSSRLASINGDSATTYIDVITRYSGAKTSGSVVTPADGGTMGRDGRIHLDGGGTVPGILMPYGDKTPALLAPGEEVTTNRNGEADTFRGELKDINAGLTRQQVFNRMIARGLADGGTVGLSDGGTARGRRGDDGWANLVGGISDAAGGLKGLKDRLKESERALQRETSQRSAAMSLRGEVAGSLAGDLTGNGLAGFDVGSKANENDAKSMTKALLKARKKGLDGPLFDFLAASGDLNLVQQFANLGRAGIRQREQQYSSTNRAQGALGDLAVREKYNQSIDSMTREIGQLTKTNRSLQQQINKMEKAVERGAERGTRKGNDDKNRGTLQRTRAGR